MNLKNVLIILVYVAEVKDVLDPFLKLVERDSECSNLSAVTFVKTKYEILLNYCTNISFYFMLKAKRLPLNSHPVIKQLAQCRQLLSKLESKQGNLLDEIKETLQAHKNGQPLFNTMVCSEIQPKKKKKKEKRNAASAQKRDEDESDLLEEERMDSNDIVTDLSTAEQKENWQGMQEAEKRGITYQISKNRGLTPYRKKELRNPRVKHRNKYRKAKIRRKGAVSLRWDIDQILYYGTCINLLCNITFVLLNLNFSFTGQRSCERNQPLWRRVFGNKCQSQEGY